MLRDELQNTQARLDDLAPKKRVRVRTSDANKMVELEDVQRAEDEHKKKEIEREAKKKKKRKC